MQPRLGPKKHLGVSKDQTKAKQYFKKGAMAGCTSSRFNIGVFDAAAGGFDRAIKHWLIAASCGYVRALVEIKEAVITGDATKDHYRQALRGYQLYLDEVKSFHRDRAAAAAFSDVFKYLF
jgi:TPR repeat protein